MKALRTSLFAALGFTILVAALVPSLSDARGFGFKFGFANRVAGSYLAVADIPSLAPPFQFLITFNRDGTVQMSTVADFVFGSPWYGSWVRTARHEISGTMLRFRHLPDGTLEAISRIDFTARFSNESNTFIGDVSLMLFACTDGECVDPLDPDSEPIASFDGTISGQRIPANTDNAD